MKTLFIESKSKINISTIDFKLIPKELVLAYTIQYKSLAETIKNNLKKLGYNIKGFYQVLGCTKLKLNSPILLISNGKFHALNLALQNEYPIYIYSTETNSISLFDNKEVNKIKQNKEILARKFFNSNKIGLIISSKPGQENIIRANNLKILLKKQNKEAFLFISNNINLSEIENFNMDFWINTACPGLAYDNPKIANIDDIFSILNEK